MRARMPARFSAIVMAAKLSIHHFSLNAPRRSVGRLNAGMPLVLMTDDRAADWAGAARRLPRGSVLVVRARDAKRRLALAGQLCGLGRLVIADDPALAHALGAAGLHLPEKRMKE